MSDNLLVPLDNYLASGIHIGTKYKTNDTKRFIYKVRPDGLKVMDVENIDQRLRYLIKFLAQFEPKDIFVACKRDTAHKAMMIFEKVTGITVKTGRYLPGTFTNTEYYGFKEPKVLLVCDPWADGLVVKDAMKIKIPVVALVNSNNVLNRIDYAIPCNNRGKNSIALIFYILAKELLKEKGLIKEDSEFTYSLSDFNEEPEKEKVEEKQ